MATFPESLTSGYVGTRYLKNKKTIPPPPQKKQKQKQRKKKN